MRPIHFPDLTPEALAELRVQIDESGHGTIVVAGDEVHTCTLGDSCVYAADERNQS